MELNQLKTLARRQMATVAYCMLCKQPYVCKDLHNQPVCGSQECQDKWKTAPRTIRRQSFVNKEGKTVTGPMRMHLSEVERQKILANSTTHMGTGHDVRRGYENY